MRILFYTDVHFCKTSSIIIGRGSKYSTRLENLIQSLNWAEKLAGDHNVDKVVCLGDFFDRPNLNDEELTALNEIKWFTKAQHHFLVGNHEIVSQSLDYSSTQVLNSITNTIIEDKVRCYYLDDKTQLLFLPYIIEENRKTIKEYIYNCLNRDPNQKLIICSHNDIKGIQYGVVESKEGFDLKDIEKNCDLFLNGHLHNGGWLNKNKTILNLGNLTGQNFSEDASKYKHQVLILDTNIMKLEFYENPYAFNFYKLQISNVHDLSSVSQLKQNAVLSLKCETQLVEQLKALLNSNPNIIQYKLTTYDIREFFDLIATNSTLIGIDNHLDQFKSFILSRDDNEFSDKTIVNSELMEVCK